MIQFTKTNCYACNPKFFSFYQNSFFTLQNRYYTNNTVTYCRTVRYRTTEKKIKIRTYLFTKCLCFRSTVEEKEQKQLLMDLEVVMNSNDCAYIVQFYGAIFKVRLCNEMYEKNRSVPFLKLEARYKSHPILPYISTGTVGARCRILLYINMGICCII
jgi:hypothetical protein